MALLFGCMCALQRTSPATADTVQHSLAPALHFLKTWLAVLFVPALVVLPLKASMVRGVEFRLGAILVVGAAASLAATGVFAKYFQEQFPTCSDNIGIVENDKTTTNSGGKSGPSLPLLRWPLMLSAASLATYSIPSLPSPVATVLRKVFEVSSTVTGFVAGFTVVPPLVRKVVHPVLFTALFTLLALVVLGRASIPPIPLEQMLREYLIPAGAGASAGAGAVTVWGGIGSLLTGLGSGNLVASLLGPAIVSLGLQLYQHRAMLQRNAALFLSATACSACTGLLSSALLSRVLLQQAAHLSGSSASASTAAVALATLTRSITSPLALSGAALTGADPSLSALFAVSTGIIGASLCGPIMKLLAVRDPLSIGLTMGGSAHGIGAAALIVGPSSSTPSSMTTPLTSKASTSTQLVAAESGQRAADAAAFSASVVAMALTGLWTVLLLAQGSVRSVLVRIAVL